MIDLNKIAPWTSADSNAANKEGWNVFNEGEGDARLERDDEQDMFKSDDDVWEFVAKKAAEGSDRHRRALLHVALHNPPEFEQIVEHLETV
jgi:hypothetical protein